MKVIFLDKLHSAQVWEGIQQIQSLKLDHHCKGIIAACALRQMQLQSLLHRRKSPQKQTRDGWCFLRSCAVSLKADPPKKEQEQPNVRTPRFCLSMNIILVINQSLLLVGTYQPFWLSHSLSRLMGNSPC